VARVPQLARVGVEAAEDWVRFEWAWRGSRRVEVRVLRSEEWFCDSPDAYVDGSWVQRPAYVGDAAGFADRGVATDRDVFYSLFARYPGKRWRTPVRVRVFAAGHEPAALGLPASGREWRPPEVADGHRRVDIDGDHEYERLVAALLPDGLLDGRPEAHVHGQSGSCAAPASDRPSGIAPDSLTALRRWRIVWTVVGGVSLVALAVCAAAATPAALLALGFTAFALQRPVVGPDAEPPHWLHSALIGLTVVTVMVAFALLMVTGASSSALVPGAMGVFMAGVVTAEWALPYGGFAFGHFVYGRSGLPDRVWLVALLLLLDVACVALGLAGALLTIVVAVGFAIAGLSLHLVERGGRRAEAAERMRAALDEGRRRRVEELLPPIPETVDPPSQDAERPARARDWDDEAWEPPTYRV
jgi:hypothetical protein